VPFFKVEEQGIMKQAGSRLSAVFIFQPLDMLLGNVGFHLNYIELSPINIFFAAIHSTPLIIVLTDEN
jgi:hypothetical protein